MDGVVVVEDVAQQTDIHGLAAMFADPEISKSRSDRTSRYPRTRSKLSINMRHSTSPTVAWHSVPLLSKTERAHAPEAPTIVYLCSCQPGARGEVA